MLSLGLYFFPGGERQEPKAKKKSDRLAPVAMIGWFLSALCKTANSLASGSGQAPESLERLAHGHAKLACGQKEGKEGRTDWTKARPRDQERRAKKRPRNRRQEGLAEALELQTGKYSGQAQR